MTRRTANVRIGSSALVVFLGLMGAPVARGQSVTVSQPVDGGCLACVATREATSAEWAAALAATATIKASPEAVRATAARSAAVDSRSSIERMRAAAERDYGEDLAHLSSLAERIDREAQVYLANCYDRYLTPLTSMTSSRPLGSLARIVPPPPTEAGRLLTRRAPAPISSEVEQSSGTPVLVWSQTWEPIGLMGGEAISPCEGMWRDISAGANAIKAALDEIQADARANDVYPGVLRDLYDTYGLNSRLRE
jgi:hypothetical protein